MPGVTHVGIGALENLGPELRRLRAKKALLVCDPGIFAAGLHERVIARLREEGLGFEQFTDVELEPSTDNAEMAAETAAQSGADVIIGLGGGSSLDVAKAAAVLVTNDGVIRDYVGVDAIPLPGLPTVLVPTTAGTGSEVSPNAIFTLRDEQIKKGVVSRHLMAAVAIVDPELTLSCPPAATAAAGIDALVHAIESYTSVKATVQTDLYGLEGMRLIAGSLRQAYAEGGDLAAREKMSWGSYLAGVGLANAGVGAVHALAYPVGARLHTTHGLTNGLLLPFVLEANLASAPERYAQAASALGVGDVSGSLDELSAALLGEIRSLLHDIGIPSRLRDAGARREDLEAFADGAVEQTRLLANNPTPLSRAEILEIFERAY